LDDVPIAVRDGIVLLADVIRPDAPGRFPVLLAAFPYPRQIQDLGAPLGFIEPGASDFFVPRGYVHVIANLRAPAALAECSGSSTPRNAGTCTTYWNLPRPGQPWDVARDRPGSRRE
jgi:hypothetical protein